MIMKRIKLFFVIVLILSLTKVQFILPQKLHDAELFNNSYPRAMYFRVPEFVIRNEYADQPAKYSEWRDRFSDLSGIMGKTEHEELLRHNPHQQIYDWFKRFKQDFPEKIVMVHFNGRGRIPNYNIDKFSPGHWSYFEGSMVNSYLPDNMAIDYTDEIWIEVDDVSKFRMDNGSSKKVKDDITLVRKKKDGNLDWEHAEYVRLLDIGENEIKIKRAMFGSIANEFRSGRTYAAPHIMGGPWGSTANMVWYYNFSTTCPMDKKGKTCTDVLLDELADNFAKGGRWEFFDGVEFDVMTDNPTTGYHENRRKLGQRADTNGDCEQDDGIIDGINVFGLGNFDFITRLRERIGPDKILSADGREKGCQKVGNGSFNGVEMEGVPEQRPYGWATWSTVYNTLNVWKTVSAKPDFNYSAFRYNNPDRYSQDVLFRYYRLAFALSAFTETFVAVNSWTTLQGVPDIKEVFENPEIKTHMGWLGKPVDAPIYIARNQSKYPDLLNGKGKSVCFPENLFNVKANSIYIKTDNEYISDSGIMRLIPGEGNEMAFKLCSIPYKQNQVYIEFKLRSVKNNPVYPRGYNRIVEIFSEGQSQRFKTMLMPVTQEWNTFRVYFCNTIDELDGSPVNFNITGQDHINLVFKLSETIDPVEVSEITVRSAPEVIVRKFENGYVIANLSASDYYYEPLRINVPSKDALFLIQNLNLHYNEN